MQMNKTDLIKMVAEKANKPTKEVAEIIDSFFKNPLMKVALNWKTDSKLSIKYKLFWFLLSKGFVNQAIYIVKKVYKLRN